MTRRSNRPQAPTEAKESKNTKVACCRDCVWAKLVQYGDNPVLAACTKRPQPYNERFPYEMMVASAKWICPLFHQDEAEKMIEKRLSVRHGGKAA